MNPYTPTPPTHNFTPEDFPGCSSARACIRGITPQGGTTNRSTPFPHNTLIFAGGKGSAPCRFQGPLKPDCMAPGSPRSIPAREYAMEALKNAVSHRRPQNNLSLARHLCACLLYADRGETGESFARMADTLLSQEVAAPFVVPHRHNSPGNLSVGSHPRRRNKGAVAAIIAFLTSPEARVLLMKRGFLAGLRRHNTVRGPELRQHCCPLQERMKPTWRYK